MKLNELKEIIGEEVRRAVRREFKLLRESLENNIGGNTSLPVLKEIIGEEVRRAVRREFKLLRESLENNIGSNTSLWSMMEEERMEEENVVKKVTPTLFQENTNRFANILNETLATPREDINDQQVIERQNLQSKYASLVNGAPEQTKITVPKTSASGKNVDPDALPDYLLKAMNKDYRSTLKAMKKSADMKRPPV
jgi:hypothetical protein